ncbi:metaxin-2-like [Centruroides vittatus]|uniref:metaxin-2-like n=1 Tax=Centruroides vittatus TaxID=120091 RepID=UPI00350EF309
MPSVLLTESIAVEMGAMEPWPEDARLYQPSEYMQILLPDYTNCLSIQAFLRMCCLKYRVVMRKNAEHMSPSGHVPFLKCGAFVVSEIDPIIAFVNTKGIHLSQHLDGAQKADMRAYMALINVVLGNAELYVSWCHNATVNEKTKPRCLSVYSWPLNYFLYWQKKSVMKSKLASNHWLDKTLDEVYEEVTSCCHALSERLGKQTYFFGTKPTELDALVYGHLMGILTTALPDNGLASIVRNFENLLKLVSRIDVQYFRQNENLYDSPLEE